MTAEVMQRLQKVEANTAAILKLLSEAATEKKPPLTQRALAKRLGVSVWTINRKVARGEIRTVDGRIPHSELERLTS